MRANASAWAPSGTMPSAMARPSISSWPAPVPTSTPEFLNVGNVYGVASVLWLLAYQKNRDRRVAQHVLGIATKNQPKVRTAVQQ
jgi:hypothetical protein